MFNNTKYTKWYFNIINNAKNRNIEGYTENHHIIPKALGGNNKKENIIKLSAKEHYVVHILLMKMCIDKIHKQKMASAYLYMSKMKNIHTNERYNSKLYEYHKIIRSKILSEQMSGSGNPMFGKVHNDNTRKKISDARIGVNINTVEELQKKRERWIKNNPNYDPVAAAKRTNSKSYNWKVLTPNGQEYIIRNLKQFCRENNVPMTTVYGNYKGWKCERII